MNKKAIFVVGTTASGKSDAALDLAEEALGCIINCDSIQLYQNLEIGSAQPSAEDKSRVPHYLFSCVAPPDEVTAGVYRRAHMEILDEIPGPAFVVGGTGFYFQALEKGMFPAPAADASIQNEIETVLASPQGEDILWDELRRLDPQSAQRIHKNDHYRLVRALELIRRAGKPLSEIRKEFEAQVETYPWPYMKVGIFWNKEELEKRVLLRTAKMLKNGLIDEVRGLLDQGLEAWSPLQSVGYKEVTQMLQENKTKEWLAEEISRATMRLAKKQRTWFQRDTTITWFEGKDLAKGTLKEKVMSFLGRT
jgi:tRNA dimethylallyltransferase